MNSRQKGCRGEREVAEYLRSRGFPARRGQQFSGSPESPDVVCGGLAGFHLEVKRAEVLSLYPAMEQAVRDAGGKVPTVWHRRNGKEWLVVMRAEDFLALARAPALGPVEPAWAAKEE